MHLVGVQTAGQIVQCHLQNVLAHLLRVVGVVGQRLRVGDHDKDLVIFAGILQPHPLLQRADIVANVQAAGGTVAGQNNFFHDVLLLTGNSLSLRTLFAASSLGEGAFGSTARRLTLPEGGFSVFFIIMLSIAPRGGAVNKTAGKRKKRWKFSIALLAPLA